MTVLFDWIFAILNGFMLESHIGYYLVCFLAVTNHKNPCHQKGVSFDFIFNICNL